MIPGEPFSVDSLFTLAGSAVFVWIVTNAIGYVVMYRDTEQFRRWLGLILSLIVAFLGTTRMQQPTGLTWVVAVANGFLVYATAVGVNAIVEGAGAERKASHPFVEQTGHKASKRSFIRRWW
jgi:hypothetical protein